MNFATAKIGEHEGRYPLILKQVLRVVTALAGAGRMPAYINQEDIMTRGSIMLALGVALLSIASAAHAGKRCPWDDKQLPEKSKVCRSGTIHLCEDGQWVDQGTKCSGSGPRFQGDEQASLSTVRRIFGEPRSQRDAIVARIAPLS